MRIARDQFQHRMGQRAHCRGQRIGRILAPVGCRSGQRGCAPFRRHAGALQAQQLRHEVRRVACRRRLDRTARSCGHPLKLRLDHRPQPGQRRGRQRCGQRTGAVPHRDPRQVQTADRARGGDVEHAGLFIAAAFAFHALQKIIGRRLIRIAAAPLIHRSRNQTLACGQREAAPDQQRRIAALGGAMQAGQDHGVELKPLGLVDGHQLQPAVGLRVGRGKQAAHVVFKAVEDEASRRIERVEAVEESLRVGQVVRTAQAKRTAEFLPGVLDPTPASLPPLPGQRLGQHLAHVGQPLLAI